MVVCKCRKATKLYCFVHKVPVCGECICFPEHQICVVRTYSEWVIDGEYDWPPKCCLCHVAIEEGTDPQTTRLGCLHIIHTSCLDSHIKGFPPHTAPAGYTCPACSTPIWPPKSIKDSGSRLHSKLKEAIMQSGLEKNLFGNHPVSLPATESRVTNWLVVKWRLELDLVGRTTVRFPASPIGRGFESNHPKLLPEFGLVGPKGRIPGGAPKKTESRVPPPAFSSDPLMHVSTTGGSSSTVGKDTNDIVEIDGPSSVNPSLSNQHSNFTKSASPVGPGATTRKSAFQIDRQNSEISYYGDDEDGNQKKYTRRGTLRHKFLRSLIPFWSSALPTLPVTAPPRKDTSNDAPEGRVRLQRSSRMDPRKILLIIAIMACIATMGILYYRLAQRGLGDDLADDEQ